MIRLFITDDHPVVREGLKRVIARCNDITVVGEAADAEAGERQKPAASAERMSRARIAPFYRRELPERIGKGSDLVRASSQLTERRIDWFA